jgi:hypothetical protein
MNCLWLHPSRRITHSQSLENIWPIALGGGYDNAEKKKGKCDRNAKKEVRKREN